jgi:hypothetical protein
MRFANLVAICAGVIGMSLMTALPSAAQSGIKPPPKTEPLTERMPVPNKPFAGYTVRDHRTPLAEAETRLKLLGSGIKTRGCTHYPDDWNRC